MPINRAHVSRLFSLLVILAILASLVIIAGQPRQIAAQSTESSLISPNDHHRLPSVVHVPTVVIQGHITDAAGEPVAQRRVRGTLSDGTVAQEVLTDSEGHFIFPAIQTDTYQLWVIADDGRPLTWEGNRVFSVSEKARVTPIEHHIQLNEIDTSTNKETPALAGDIAATDDTAMVVNAQVTTSAQITGRVTEQDTNIPLTGIHVETYDRRGILQASTMTNDTGVYLLDGLESGFYWLYFEAPDVGPAARYGSRHYLDAVSVTDTSSVSNIDIQLTQLGQIAGRVAAADSGVGLADVVIQIYDATGRFIDSVRSGNDGSYSTTGLPDGTYTLYAQTKNATGARAYLPAFYGNQTNLLVADTVQVSGGIIDNVNLDLPRGGEISGQVTGADSGQPVTSVSVHVYDASYQQVDSVSVDNNGIYTVTGLPIGTYKLYFQPFRSGDGAAYQAIYYQNKMDPAMADGIAITGSTSVPNVNVALPVRSMIPGQITGQVTDVTSGSPLPGIIVEALDGGGVTLTDDYTDENGTYTLTDLESGRYTIKFAPNPLNPNTTRYLTEYYNDRSSAIEADAVTVDAPATTTNINAALTMGGAITGMVTAADTGQSLPARVYLYDMSGQEVDSVITNSATGLYTFTPLPAGEYRLYFDPIGASVSSAPYIPIYSGGATDLANAAVITVIAGQVAEGINAQLIRGGQISGQVIAVDTGLPADGVHVAVLDTTTLQPVFGTVTNQSGRYTTDGLPNGIYRVRFTGDDAYLPAEYPTTISIDAPILIENIDSQLSRGATILGRVMDETTQSPIGGVAVSTGSCGVIERTDYTNWLGLYELPGLPTDSYDVNFTTDDENASSPYLTTTANNIAVTIPNETVHHQPLKRGGQISGLLTSEDNGKGLAGVYVYLYDSNDRLVRSIRTNEIGAYAARGLPDGNYHLYFTPDGDGASAAYLSAFYNNQADFANAQRITIAGLNHVTGINATLARGGRIAGHITDADSGRGLYDVDIMLFDQNGHYMGRAASNSDGHYITPALPNGNYHIQFAGNYNSGVAGYAYQYYSGKSILAAGNTVNVSAPNLTTGINAALTRGGRIAGTIKDLSGQRLNDVYVAVYDSTGTRVAYAYSGLDGSYRTGGLPNGSYRVGFSYTKMDACGQRTLVGYYNNKTSLETADIVAITAPVVQTAVDALLDASQDSTPTPTATATPGGGTGGTITPTATPTITPTPTRIGGTGGTLTPTPAATLAPGAHQVYLPAVSR